jgi:hypothetical protein
MVDLPPSRPGVDFVAEFWCANQVQDVYYFRRLVAQGCPGLGVPERVR